MLIRSSRLPKNQSAGRLDETPLRTVHQRPPKKIAPSNTPATNASTRRQSFIHRYPPVPPALPCLPWRPNATHSNSRSTSPATSSASVQECLPGWCLSSQIPSAAPSSVGTTTDQPISPIMPKPNQTPCVELTPRLELARRLRADLPAERRLVLRRSCCSARHSC